jgi:Acetyltransferase (GNAT) domain
VSLSLINPLSDTRWQELVCRHPRSSAFHERGWLEALACTYGYEPLVFTSAPPGSALSDGIVLCRISSWITGTRLVSLPFADHCDPLLRHDNDLPEFMSEILQECVRQDCNYLEIRPLSDIRVPCGLQVSRASCFHELSLGPTLKEIYQGLHKDCVQRKIRRAEREKLSYEVGQSEQLLEEFYELLVATRRRHHIPPQPRAWFENLLQHFGTHAQIRLARKQDIPIAAILTIRHQSCVIYKYGCSNARFHNLGGIPFLFWHLIEESKASGMERLDFGRSDLDNLGLITFKDRFGTSKRSLKYYRYPETATPTNLTWTMEAIKPLFALLPRPMLSGAGRVLYRHMG